MGAFYPISAAALQGPAFQPIEVDSVGRIDTVRGRLRTTFETIPDTRVSTFTLKLQGAGKGLLVNNTDICTAPPVATVKIEGQNGKSANQNPVLRTPCSKGR